MSGPLTPSGTLRAEIDRADGITGTWSFVVSADVPGAPPLVFNELITFDGGGGLTETNSLQNANSGLNPFAPPQASITCSEGHGNWRTTPSGKRVATTFRQLLFAGPGTSEADYGPILFPGQHIGVATIQERLNRRRDGNSEVLEGRFTIQFRNLQGVVLFSGSGTVEGRRVPIEPLMP
jgi:hypothetical protein